jgi:hypothetical protein
LAPSRVHTESDEAVDRVVGQGDRLGLAVERHDDGDRPEDLLLDRPRRRLEPASTVGGNQ